MGNGSQDSWICTSFFWLTEYFSSFPDFPHLQMVILKRQQAALGHANSLAMLRSSTYTSIPLTWWNWWKQEGHLPVISNWREQDTSLQSFADTCWQWVFLSHPWKWICQPNPKLFCLFSSSLLLSLQSLPCAALTHKKASLQSPSACPVSWL